MNAVTDEDTDFGQELARIRAAVRAEAIFTRRHYETRAEWTARIMALPPWERADAVVALLDDAYVLLRLAAKYWEPQS